MSKTMLPTKTEKSRPPSHAIVKGIILAAVVMFIAECLRVFVGSNFHCVAPGRCYRCAQPGPMFLENVQRTHGIRSIINLRDENLEEAWYREEKQAAQRLGLNLVDAGLCGLEQTPAEDFRKVVNLIDKAPEPILIHCASGSDRTGLASAIFLLIHTDMPFEEARKQLHLRYGHFPWTKKACLDRTLDSYADWLKGKEHNRDRFLDWVNNFYEAEK